MGSLMRENCSGCGFEYDSGELWEHENGCSIVLRDRLEAAIARAEAAERLAVWAVRSMAWIDRKNEPETVLVGTRPYNDSGYRTKFDGTDAGILAALRRAIEGEK